MSADSSAPADDLTRKLVAEFIGTAVLVVVAVGTAALSFGEELTGTSASAGVVTTALAFGLVLVGLIYAIGAVSGCHVNPAVTVGFLVSGRMTPGDAAAYVAAQLAGGVTGALLLWGILSGSPSYSQAGVGLGADGFGTASMVGINAVGAVITEVVLTFVFVLVVLGATSRLGSPGFAGLGVGLTLTAVHLVGIPLTGTSVNPARSLGPAVVVGGLALSQLWVFLLAPLAGGALAAVVYRQLVVAAPDDEPVASHAVHADRELGRTRATP